MPIRDQSRFKKQEVELRLFNSLKWLRPVLYLVGPNGWKAARKIKEVLKEQLPPLEEQFVRLRNLPDRFNETFLHVGWIATDEMNPDVMEEAIRIYSENGLEAAEVYLEAYYNKEWELYLKRFCFLPRIAPRTQLIELAIEDHIAGRYHASVLLVLAQIDGIVFDLVDKSFYKKIGTEHLQATETVVGDPTGLPALASLLSERRNETRDLTISLPYRHGILHGRDLGYATRRVSTKALCTLFSLRTWIIAVDRGEQFKEPEKFFDPKTATWEETKVEWKNLWETLKEYSRQQKDH